MLQCHCLNQCPTHLAGTSPRPHKGLFIPLPEPIRLASVAYGYNVNHLLVVQYLVDHAVIPNANTPKTLKTLQLAATTRPRILGQRLYPGKYTVDNPSVEGLQFLPRGLSKSDAVFRHSASLASPAPPEPTLEIHGVH
jgi:hypothetical protein